MPSFPESDFDSNSEEERYIFFSRIAAGGMGETYRSWDKHLARVVAIKIPKRSFVEKEGFLERFEREARMMQQLQHPQIVPISDVGIRDGLPYFAMPFLPGGSLSARRARDKHGAPLPNRPEMLHLWLPGIAAALDYLHAKNVIHRDVKPANIFCDAFGSPFLGDFGVAKVLDGASDIVKEETLTGTDVALGTEFYMAPEILRPGSRLMAATDQYALAVTVYELLVGRRPFTGETAHIFIEVATQAAPRIDQFRQDLPASLVQAVHRGLAKQPGERFKNCTEFARHVLAQVRHMPEESGIVRLACPHCSYIIRIAMQDAGRRGRCPGCRKRLFIADDLSALWTQSEQNELAAHLSGVSATSAVDQAENEAIDETAFDFKPLSRPTKITKPLLPKKYVPLVMNGILAAVCTIGLIVLWPVIKDIIWPPRPFVVKKNPESLTADDGRLEIFGPRGFERSSKSLEYLAEYTSNTPSKLPRIRVLKGGNGVPGSLRTTPERRISGVAGKVQSTICVCDVAGRTYSVEVTAVKAEAETAEQLCKAVASWLRQGKVDKRKSSEVTGLRVEYFKGRNFEQTIAYPDNIQNRELSIDWDNGQQINGLPNDNFSIRWTGSFVPEWSGNHWFSGFHDDGLRVWVDGEPIVDEWGRVGEFESRRKYLLKDKRYPIKIDYFEAGGKARLELWVRGEQGQRKILQESQLRPD